MALTAGESKEEALGHIAAIDVEKAEIGSTTDTSLDVPISHIKLDRNRFSVAGAANLSLDDVEAVDVQIRGLAISVDTAPSWLDPGTYPELFSAGFKTAPRIKTLLHSVDADLKPGTLTAIIGGSGSGKTTLLNNLAERVVSSRLSQQGLAVFNGQLGVNSVRHAYVMQQDILLPTLTVRETLRYSADLRLPSSTSAEDRERIVEEVIRELGLKECANTRIGNSQHRGCSGGEKRRVSIGVQLLSNPSVLFLDEPTTGLDATSAFQLIRTLKALAQKGRNIITTIHQPRSEIWDLFDNLIILSKGSPVFSGPVSECLPWFKDLGHQLPPFVNPAEFVIDIAAVDNRTPELEAETSTRLESLKAAWRIESESRFPALQGIAEMRRNKHSKATTHAGFLRQVRILTDRTLKVTYRDPLGMTASILEAIIMGLVIGYLFYNVGRDQAGIRSREGLLYICVGLQGYLILMFETYRLTIDMPTFDRESSEHCVDAVPYILSRRLARLVTEDFPVPFLFSLILYFMAGFDHDAAKFFTFFSISFVNHFACIMCAFTCVVTYWKKLQAQLKAEAASKPSTKRKAEEQLQSSLRKKPFETSKNKASNPLNRKDKLPVRRMGGVQSSPAIDKPKQTPSPSLAIWAEDHGVSAEDLAEAYGLGVKGNSLMFASTKDKVNHGLTNGLEIGKYVAIDCEMVGVGPGGHESALARISIVDFHGRQVYDSYVKPKERVTNWRTAVSGISQKEMRFARDFDEVQKEVSDILRDRILIGHDIKHDLDALKLSHSLKNIRDTAKYPAFKKYGHGRKPALKILAKEILGIEIQSGPHSSTEDARATMLLFRKHKSGFDMDHVNRFAPKQPVNAGASRLKKKTKKK